jgi:hypothetical protein
MHRLLAPAIAILLLTVATSSAVDPKTPNYYPLGNNNRWEYRAEAKGMKFDVVIQTKAVKRNKKTVYELEETGNGLVRREELIADEKGVHYNLLAGVKINKPLALIHYPIKPGKWSGKITSEEGQEVEFTTTQEEAVDVKVPAGKYRAIPVKMVLKTGGVTVTDTTWYAENVGPVKQVATVLGVETKMELTKFTPGK